KGFLPRAIPEKRSSRQRTLKLRIRFSRLTSCTFCLRDLILIIKGFTVDANVAQAEARHVLYHVRCRYVVEGAISQAQVVDGCLQEALHVQRTLAPSAFEVVDNEVAHDGRKRTLLALFVIEVYGDDGFRDLADLYVPEIEIFQEAAAHGRSEE